MNKTIIAALMGATLVSGTAIAATQSTPAAPAAQKHSRFDPWLMADTNKDGVVTQAEMLSAVDARFARLDTNKDGVISPEERRAARSAVAEKFRARRAATPEVSAERAKRPDRPHLRGEAGGPRGERAERPERPPLTLAAERERALKRFALADRNGDGKIDQAEREMLRQIVREFGGGRGPGKWRHHGAHGGKQPKAPAAAVVPARAN